MVVPRTVTIDPPTQKQFQKWPEVPFVEPAPDECVVVGDRHVTSVADLVDGLVIGALLRTGVRLVTLYQPPRSRSSAWSGAMRSHVRDCRGIPGEARLTTT